MPILYIAIGPSGSGKSTVFKKLKETNPELEHFSLDALRHKWYDMNDYANAFKLACADKTFKAEADKVYQNIINELKDVYVDNMNLSPKGRRLYLQVAKKLGYKTVAIVFDVPLETLLARQKTRGDKSVPDNVVIQQFSSFQQPTLEEFDEIIPASSIN
jgi:predicted kinase